jgi:hypothetical protein
MWRWWEKSDPTRLASVPGLIGEPSLNDTLLIQGGGSLRHDAEDDRTLPFRKSSAINYPRTLKELLAMTEAAREAKWGEQGETTEAFTSEFPMIGNDFFEDDSGDSSDSDEEQDDEAHFSSEPEHVKKVDYSGAPTIGVRGKGDRSVNDTTEFSKDADGVTPDAASDMLTPFVKVSNQYNVVSLSNQNPALAIAWKLGDFDVSYDPPSMDSRHVSTKSIINASTVDSYPSSKQGKNGSGKTK